jgi:hypothetical protein
MLQIDERLRPTATGLIANFLEYHSLVERSTESSGNNRTNIRHAFLSPNASNIDKGLQHLTLSTAPSTRWQPVPGPLFSSLQASSMAEGFPIGRSSAIPIPGLGSEETSNGHSSLSALSREAPLAIPLGYGADLPLDTDLLSSATTSSQPIPIRGMTPISPASAMSSKNPFRDPALSSETLHPSFSRKNPFRDLAPFAATLHPSSSDTVLAANSSRAPAVDRTSVVPSLEDLIRANGNSQNLGEDMCKAVIIKAQPQYSHETLAHLTGDQLVKHVDDLVDWWKQSILPKDESLSIQTPPIRISAASSLPTKVMQSQIASTQHSSTPSTPSITLGSSQSSSSSPSSSSLKKNVSGMFSPWDNFFRHHSQVVFENGVSFHDAFRANPYSYKLWYCIYKTSKHEFMQFSASRVKGLEHSNPGFLMVMTNLYASDGDYEPAVNFGTSLQSLDPMILRKAIMGTESGTSITPEVKEYVFQECLFLMDQCSR